LAQGNLVLAFGATAFQPPSQAMSLAMQAFLPPIRAASAQSAEQIPEQTSPLNARRANSARNACLARLDSFSPKHIAGQRGTRGEYEPFLVRSGEMSMDTLEMMILTELKCPQKLPRSRKARFGKPIDPDQEQQARKAMQVQLLEQTSPVNAARANAAREACHTRLDSFSPKHIAGQRGTLGEYEPFLVRTGEMSREDLEMMILTDLKCPREPPRSVGCRGPFRKSRFGMPTDPDQDVVGVK